MNRPYGISIAFGDDDYIDFLIQNLFADYELIWKSG